MPGLLQRREPQVPRRAPEQRCRPKFVDGTNQSNPDCDPKVRVLAERCKGTIYKYIFPGSQYDTAQGKQAATAELQRAVDFYKQYCIDLTVKDITFSAALNNNLKAAYSAWYADVLQQIGGASHLGTTSISGQNRANFRAIINTIQLHARQDIAPKGTKLVIVFIDEYIGGADGHDTLISSCQEHIHQIGINWFDRGSSYILAHELIHALGKPAADTTGSVTWIHSSNCANALSKVKRSTRVTEDFSDRLLDVQEYLEIGNNRGAGILKCHKVP